MAEEKEEVFIVKYKKEILIGLIAFLMMVFIVQNSAKIPFYILWIKIEISTIFLITLFFGMGLLTMYIRYYYILKEKNKKIKELEKQIKGDSTDIAETSKS